MQRGDLEKAKGIARKYITDNIPCNMEYEMLFHRARELYTVLGNDEMQKKYQEKIDRCYNEYQKYISKVDEDDNPFYFRGDTIVKDKKVYPNEPCPCGSGKKYKKCCGKK